MRKIIFVLLALLLTLAGCGKEALPETSSVPSEDTHITSPAEEKRNKARCLFRACQNYRSAGRNRCIQGGKRYFRQFRKGAETKHIFRRTD